MNKKSKITVGIPVYNNGKVIKKRIQDICSQTFQDFTIVISDNGSTDQTRKICEEISKMDDRITFFHHKKKLIMPQSLFLYVQFLMNNLLLEF